MKEMKIIQCFSNLSLTKDQKELVNILGSFIDDNTDCLIIKGYAGSGKTFMLSNFVNYLENAKMQFRLLAPTGRAASVLSIVSGKVATTIHKAIYSYDSFTTQFLSDKDLIDNEEAENITLVYSIKPKLNQDAIIIVDEASLISNNCHESEFVRFGTGYLLDDLFTYVSISPNSKRKIILVGDSAQLPPVNMATSPALDAEYIVGKYNVSVKSFTLSEVVRQKSESGILKNAVKLRESIEKSYYDEVEINSHSKDVHCLDEKSILKEYKLNQVPERNLQQLIITDSNRKAYFYNNYVRQQIFTSTEAQIGDIVLVYHNYYANTTEIMNGTFGIVEDISPALEERRVKIKRKNNKEEVQLREVILRFRKMKIRFQDISKKTVFEGLVLENYIYSENSYLPCEVLQALFVDFRIRNRGIDIKSDEFAERLRNDRYYNALRVKFGYAATCHKAQGGQWDKVFVDCKTYFGYFNEQYFRWLYTAITRATAILFAINAPSLKITRSTESDSLPDIQYRQDLIILNPDLIYDNYFVINIRTDLTYIQRAITLAVVNQLRNEKVTIVNVEYNEFHNIFRIARGKDTVRIKVYYNKQNKITSINHIEKEGFAECIASLLKPLTGKVLIIDEIIDVKNDAVSVSFSESFMDEFYKQVQAGIKNTNIIIEDIKQNPYLHTYSFKENNFTAVIDCYYDKKRRFGKFRINNKKTTSIDLANRALKILACSNDGIGSIL